MFWQDPHKSGEYPASAVSIDQGPGTEAERDQGKSPPALSVPAASVTTTTTRRNLVVGKGSAALGRVKSSSPVTYWGRLNAVDFMTSATQFSALAILCLIPVLLIVATATGHDIRQTLSSRMGLNPQAAKDLNDLMSSGHHALVGLNLIGIAFLLFGGLGIASTLESWYTKVYGLPPLHKRILDLLIHLVWIFAFVVYYASQEFVVREIGGVAHQVPVFAVSFFVALVFYSCTIFALLGGRLGLRSVLPGGLATAFCVTGLSVFSYLFFSGYLISNFTDYGALGVVMVVLSYFIGLGVCIHLGAVFGAMWNESHIFPAPRATWTPGATSGAYRPTDAASRESGGC
jgi:membrane protein